MDGYMKNIRRKSLDKKKEALYKNLPKQYHKYIDQAVEHIDAQTYRFPTSWSHVSHATRGKYGNKKSIYVLFAVFLRL